MEHVLFLLLSNYIVSSKRTSGNWYLHYFPIFFLTLPKNRKRSNGIYYHNLYPPNWLYPLILVLSLATIIAISNWNYLLLFSPRKPNNPRIFNYCKSQHINYHHECQCTCIRSTKYGNKDKHFFFTIYLTCSTFAWSKLRIESELAPA